MTLGSLSKFSIQIQINVLYLDPQHCSYIYIHDFVFFSENFCGGVLITRQHVLTAGFPHFLLRASHVQILLHTLFYFYLHELWSILPKVGDKWINLPKVRAKWINFAKG